LSSIDRAARQQEAESLFLSLLKQFDENGRNVSQAPTANNYAPTAFARESAAKDKKFRKADFEAAMLRLFEGRRIHVQEYRRDGHARSRNWLGACMKGAGQECTPCVDKCDKWPCYRALVGPRQNCRRYFEQRRDRLNLY